MRFGARMRITKSVKEQYEALLDKEGEYKFYRHVLGQGFISRHRFDDPDLMMLDQSDAFFCLFRRTGNEKHFVIAKLLRRAAHKLYREFRRINDERPKNSRFLQLVSGK